MRTRTLMLTLMAGMLFIDGCSDSTGLALPELVITNTWDVDGDPDRDFSFQATTDEPGTSGTFTGTEFVGAVENPLSGSWGNGELTFTVGGTRDDAVYYGTFTNLTNRITVSTSGETITLVRQTN